MTKPKPYAEPRWKLSFLARCSWNILYPSLGPSVRIFNCKLVVWKPRKIRGFNPGRLTAGTWQDTTWLRKNIWTKPSFSGSMLIFGGVPIRIPFIKGFQESKPPKPPTNWNLLIFCNITWKDASSKLSKSMQKSSSNQQNMFEQNVWSNLLVSCF